MPVLHPGLQYTTNLRHKIIRVSFRARQTKATLTRKGYPPHILSTTRAQVLTVSALFSPTPQHLLHHLLVVLSSIRLVALFELIPVIFEYLTEGIPIDCFYPLLLALGPPTFLPYPC